MAASWQARSREASGPPFSAALPRPDPPSLCSKTWFRWRPWSPASGRPGFTSATSVIFLDLPSAPPGYSDLFAFEAFVLAGDAIVEANVAGTTPLGADQRALARALADEVAGRYLGLPG